MRPWKARFEGIRTNGCGCTTDGRAHGRRGCYKGTPIPSRAVFGDRRLRHGRMGGDRDPPEISGRLFVLGGRIAVRRGSGYGTAGRHASRIPARHLEAAPLVAGGVAGAASDLRSAASAALRLWN